MSAMPKEFLEWTNEHAPESMTAKLVAWGALHVAHHKQPETSHRECVTHLLHGSTT